MDVRDPWAVIGTLALADSVAMIAWPSPFELSVLEELCDPRCPYCRYRYSHPVAALTGRDCGA